MQTLHHLIRTFTVWLAIVGAFTSADAAEPELLRWMPGSCNAVAVIHMWSNTVSNAGRENSPPSHQGKAKNKIIELEATEETERAAPTLLRRSASLQLPHFLVPWCPGGEKWFLTSFSRNHVHGIR